MGALTTARTTREFRAKKLALPLAIGAKCFRNGRAVIDYSTGTVKQAQAGTTFQSIGEFQDTYDNTSGSATVNVLVDLDIELVARRYDNDAGSPVAAANLGQVCYWLDDHTVTMASAGNSPAGIVWDVDTAAGIAVQAFVSRDAVLPVIALPAFASNAIAVTPALAQMDALFDIPTTAAASTVTLQTAIPDGTRVSFCADGTKNGHTVQYVDQAGTTNLTAALTASKRHLVVAVKENGKWFATSSVSP